LHFKGSLSGPAGLNGFRQFISLSKKTKEYECFIPHVLVLYHDKANQAITNDVDDSEDRVGSGYADLSWN